MKGRWWGFPLAGAVFFMGCSLFSPKPAPPPAAPPPASAPKEAAPAVSPAPSSPQAPPARTETAPASPRQPAPPAPSAPSAPPEAEAKTPAKAQETYFSHTVRFPGETVSIIAGWYTGDIENWKALAQANPQLNPNRIHVGLKILIPESMMKTREVMPREFVDSFYGKSKKEKPKSKTDPSKPEEDEFKLFGPKELQRK
jgi:hypothetical protein